MGRTGGNCGRGDSLADPTLLRTSNPRSQGSKSKSASEHLSENYYQPDLAPPSGRTLRQDRLHSTARSNLGASKEGTKILNRIVLLHPTEGTGQWECSISTMNTESVSHTHVLDRYPRGLQHMYVYSSLSAFIVLQTL